MLENVKSKAVPIWRSRGFTMEMSRDQCRAGRALLRWSQPRLAEEANVGYSTIVNFELGTRRNVTPEKVLAIRHALELAGVEFDGNGGVKLRKDRRK